MLCTSPTPITADFYVKLNKLCFQIWDFWPPTFPIYIRVIKNEKGIIFTIVIKYY